MTADNENQPGTGAEDPDAPRGMDLVRRALEEARGAARTQGKDVDAVIASLGLTQMNDAGALVCATAANVFVLREGTPSVSQNRPVLENRSRLDVGTIPRIGTWLKRFAPKEG